MGNSYTQSQLSNGEGFRIIFVESNSLGSTLNLQIFLDFIIKIKSAKNYFKNELEFPDLDENEFELLESDEPIQLTILNLFTFKNRTIYVSEPRSITKLGLQIRKESYRESLILHITNVLTKSPAQESGLKKNDYVLGMISHRYSSIGEFSDLVTGMACAKQAIELCIFSPTRLIAPHIITINPNFDWGGQGALGCEFAPTDVTEIISEYNNEDGADNNTNLNSKQIQEENILQMKEEIQEDEQNQQEIKQPAKYQIINETPTAQGEEEQPAKQQINYETPTIQGEEPQKQQINNETPTILGEEEQPAKQQINYETPTIQGEEPQKQQINYETPTAQGEEIIQFKGILRFNFEDSNEDDRQISTDQVELTKTKDIDLSLINNSFQSKNGSQDYSHLEQNKE